jgi:hypothetical protein
LQIGILKVTSVEDGTGEHSGAGASPPKARVREIRAIEPRTTNVHPWRLDVVHRRAAQTRAREARFAGGVGLWVDSQEGAFARLRILPPAGP